ncbi:hypothetical protein J6590_108457 [Homalodisca vitripennis]|nr:hypothetical protein J6590_108457 [Homalodisca vitripennis]
MLHKKEQYENVKLAPALSLKVLYPTSIERQNVLLYCKLFDEKNIAALKNTDINSSTAYFMDIILKWWKVVNVKQAYKWVRFNDEYYKPINSMTDKTSLYLEKFCSWLVKWNEIEIQGEKVGSMNGKLSKETQEALLLTTKTLLEIIEFLTKNLKLSYILLGKFQTDSLEARFGQFRQMSGACYKISVNQVIQSEKS